MLFELLKDAVILLAGGAGGWYLARRFGTQADQAAKDLGVQK